MTDYFYDGIIPNYVSGTKSIKVDPTPTNSTITLTDGTTTNTLTQSDWTGNIRTVNTTANTTHYLTFSDSSATGQGHPQKVATISCNPSTGNVTATQFNGNFGGNVSIANDNTALDRYLIYAGGTGFQPLRVDSTTGPLTYNPGTGTLSTNFFTGSSTFVNLTVDSTSVGNYFIPFSKTQDPASNPLFIDNAANTMSYDPSTSTISNPIFKGKLTGAADSVVITDKNDAVTYYPVFTTAVGIAQPLHVDSVTGPLTYNPSTGALSTSFLVGDVQMSTTTNALTYAANNITIDALSRSFRSFTHTFTGTANTVSSLTISNLRNCSQYFISFRNNGSLDASFLTGLGANTFTKYSSTFLLPPTKSALMTINTITIASTTTTIVDIYLLN